MSTWRVSWSPTAKRIPSRALPKWEDYIYAYMGWNSVQVVAGCDCAVDTHPNQFPSSWRDGADNFWGMALPEYTGQSSTKTGSDLVLELANQYPGKLVVVVTGPHTDLALALQQDPSLRDKIARVTIMGGAVDVGGNIKADDPTQPTSPLNGTSGWMRKPLLRCSQAAFRWISFRWTPFQRWSSTVRLPKRSGGEPARCRPDGNPGPPSIGWYSRTTSGYMMSWPSSLWITPKISHG